MAIIQIPVSNVFPAYSFRVELEAIIYVLRFRLNVRQDIWKMDILSENRTPLINGIAVLTNWNLTGQYKTPEMPPGTFMPYDTEEKGKNPDGNDFGDRIKLLYEESI